MKFRVAKLVRRVWLATSLIIMIVACKRENSQDCMPDVKTISELTNVNGIMRLVDTSSDYIILVAQGLDTLGYVPCNLPESFEIPNLEITVSGLVKYTLDPCFFGYCPENFVITKIGKQN
jgi:hypothetical protein